MQNQSTPHIPSGLSLDDTLTALAYATSLQEKLFAAKNPQAQAQTQPGKPMDGQQSPTNAPGQDLEGKQENMAEAGKEEPITKNKPENANKEDLTSMESRIMEELGRIRGEVSEKIKGEIDKVKEDIQKAINE